MTPGRRGSGRNWAGQTTVWIRLTSRCRMFTNRTVSSVEPPTQIVRIFASHTCTEHIKCAQLRMYACVVQYLQMYDMICQRTSETAGNSKKKYLNAQCITSCFESFSSCLCCLVSCTRNRKLGNRLPHASRCLTFESPVSSQSGCLFFVVRIRLSKKKQSETTTDKNFQPRSDSICICLNAISNARVWFAGC